MTTKTPSEEYLAQSIASIATVGAGLSFALATLFLALRFYTRFKIVKRLGLDDLVLWISWLLSVGLTATVCLEVRYGMGRHIEAVPIPNLLTMGKIFYASIIIYGLTLCAVKISMLIQYLHIFSSHKGVRIACYCVLFAVTGRAIAATFATAFACTPVAYFWDNTIENGTCIHMTVLWYCNAAIDIATDLCLIVIPLVPLLQMTMPLKQKLAVSLVFILGGFGCITSILRLHSLSVVLASPDLTWNNTRAANWSCVEVNVGSICASLTALRPLVTRIFPRLFELATGSHHNTSADVALKSSAARSSTGGGGFGSEYLPGRDSERGSVAATTTMLRQSSVAETLHSKTSEQQSASLGEGSEQLVTLPTGESEEDLYHSYMKGTGSRRSTRDGDVTL